MTTLLVPPPEDPMPLSSGSLAWRWATAALDLPPGIRQVPLTVLRWSVAGELVVWTEPEVERLAAAAGVPYDDAVEHVWTLFNGGWLVNVPHGDDYRTGDARFDIAEPPAVAVEATP